MTPTITPEASRLAEERQRFEAKFPIPAGVEWIGEGYEVKDSCARSYRCDRFVGQWIAWLAAKQDAAPTSAATGKRDLQVATSASTVPDGFWLAPMEPDEAMRRSLNTGPGRWVYTNVETYQRMRDSYLARNPGACSVTDGEA